MNDFLDYAVPIGAVVLVISLFLGAALWAASYECHSRWELSGMKSEWGPFKGCLIETKPNVWIPARNYRDIE